MNSTLVLFGCGIDLNCGTIRLSDSLDFGDVRIKFTATLLQAYGTYFLK